MAMLHPPHLTPETTRKLWYLLSEFWRGGIASARDTRQVAANDLLRALNNDGGRENKT